MKSKPTTNELISIFDHIGGIIVKSDYTGKLLWVSDSFDIIFGQSVSINDGNILGMFSLMRDQNDKPFDFENIQSLPKNPFIAKINAEEKELWYQANIISEGTENDTRITIYLQDNTDSLSHQKNLTQELAKKEARLSLFERTQALGNVGSWELDLATQEMNLSENLRKIYSIPEDIEVTSDLLRSMYTDEGKIMADKAFYHALETGEPWDITVKNYDYNGNIIWLRGKGGLKIIDNKPTKILGFVEDVTNQLNSERSFRSLFDSSPIPIFTYSLKGTGIDQVNKMALSFFECDTPEELRGKNLMEISARNQNGANALALAKKFKSESNKDEIFKTEWAFRTVKGTLKEAEVSVIRVRFKGQDTILVSLLDLSEINKRQQALIDIQGNYLRAQEIAQIGNWIDNQDNDTEEFSPVAINILGLNGIAQPKLSDFLEIIDKKNSDAISSGLTELKSAGGTFRYTVKLSHDGTPPYSKVIDFTFIKETQGLSDRILATVHDVTETENAKAKVEESIKFTNAINEATPNILYVFSLESYSNIYSNKHIGEIIGYSVEEIQSMGSNFLPLLMHPDDSDSINQHFSEIMKMRDGEIRTIEYRLKSKAGKWIWLISREVVFKRNNQGIPIQTLGVAYDITRRKNAELKVKNQNFQIESILQSSRTSICSLDREQKIVFNNRLFAEFITYINGDEIDHNNLKTSETKLIGLHLKEVIRKKNNYEQFSSSINQSILIGEVQFQEKIYINGERHFFLIKINPIFITDNDIAGTEREAKPQLEGFSIFINDISELVRNQEALEKAREEAVAANKAKSIFLANMSHEIRTPMNAILGFAELMKNETEKPEIANYASTIIGSGRALLNIINDILDLSKIEAGKIELNPQFSSVDPVFNEIVTLHSYRAEKKGINLLLENNVDSKYLYFIDTVKLSQILNNLISNAIKFTDRGKVTVSCSAEFLEQDKKKGLSTLLIRVSDTGIGIPKDQQSRIFQPFIQQDEQDAKKYGGTGLGLSIISNLVKIMGGTLSLESEQNVGSHFSIQIPDIKTKLNDQVTDTAKPVNANSKGKVILSVDDSEMNQRVIKGILKRTQHEILFAMNAEEALNIFDLENPDLIIMDIQMPDMDGIQLTQKLREINKGREIPIIAATGYAFDDDDDEKNLFHDVVFKPINSKTLLGMIDKYLLQAEEKRLQTDNKKQTTLVDSETEYHVSEEEWKRFGSSINRLAITMELDSIDNLAKQMLEFYKQQTTTSEKEEERINYFIDGIEKLGKAISDFDIDSIMSTMNKLKDKFNNYNEY